MQHINTKIDTSKDFLIQRQGNGIKLLRPDNTRYADHQNNVDNFMRLPFSVYFVNTDSEIQNINESSATSSGFCSSKDAVGKSILDSLEKSNAEKIIITDKEVMHNKTMQISEIDMELKEGVVNSCLCIRLPWFNEENKIIGVMGMAIVYSIHNIGECLVKIISTGLLNTNSLPLLSSNSNGLSKRQMECLFYITKGRTIKQIATILGLSPKTVEHYLESIKLKLNCSSRAELIDTALQMKEIRESLLV
jgi:DNA-binding CsgD family transcriptional regulator